MKTRHPLPVLALILFPMLWLVCFGTASAQEPVIEIRKAVFGSGRAAILCTNKIRALVKNKKAVSTITSKWLELKNPRGLRRDELKINYKVNGKPKSLIVKGDTEVNLYAAIVEHAKKKSGGWGGQLVKFGGPINKLRTGGGGRYLIAHVKETGVLEVVDVVKKQIVKTITVPEECCFAAGESKLLIVLPRQNLIQRWDLTTFEKEKTAPLDRQYPPTLAVMGSSGDGPLALWHDGSIQLWDIDKLSKIEVDQELPGGGARRRFKLTASGDGKTICGWVSGLSGQPYHVIRVDGDTVSVSKTKETYSHGARWISPSADGSQFFQGDGAGLSRDLRKIPGNRDTIFYPSLDPRYCLKVSKLNRDQSTVSICTSIDLQPVFKFPTPLGPAHRKLNFKSEQLGFEHSLRYLPKHERMVVIPGDGVKPATEVIIRDFDLRAELDKRGKDYLFVNSFPNTSLISGTDFRYQLKTLTNAKSVSYALDFGPPGMSISETGLVTLASDKFPTTVASVSITAKSDSGSTSEHNFELIPFDKSEPAPALASKSKQTPRRGSPRRGQEANAMDGGVTIEFSGPINQFRTGGSGRYVIAHVKESGVLEVVDVVAKKIVKKIPVPEECCFAAGESKLLIARPRENLLQRWDLKTLVKESSAPLDRDNPPSLAVMGNAGHGPLALWHDKEIQFWDVETLRKIEVPQELPSCEKQFGYMFQLTASADGKTFCSNSYYSRHPRMLIRVGGNRLLESKVMKVDHKEPWMRPSFDGSQVFQGDGSVLSQDLRKVPGTKGTNYYPSHDPRFCLKVTGLHHAKSTVSICTSVDLKPVYQFPTPFGFANQQIGSNRRLGVEHFLGYSPKFKRLIVMPHNWHNPEYKIVIKDFDLASELDKLDEEYLFINSLPQTKLIAGIDFKYQMETLTNAQTVSYSVDLGPPGLEVSDTGLVTLPYDKFPGTATPVSITASSTSGLTTSHNFQLLSSRSSEVLLPGEFDQMCSGGGGAYMIFRIPERKTLLVFDLRNGRVVHEIPVTGDAKFAASNQSLVVASAEKKTIQRFNLVSGKLEKSAFLRNINPDLAVMGHAGDGPLCMWQDRPHRGVFREVRLWNLKTLKEIPKKGERLANLDENKLSVSPDGKVFVGPNIVSKSRMVAMRVGPRSTYLINSRDQLPHIGGKWWMVTEDGERVFRYQNIQYDRQMREFNGVSKPNRNTVIYPNFDGRFSISLEQRGQEAYLSLLTTHDLAKITSVKVKRSHFKDHSVGQWGRLGNVTRIRYFHYEKMLATIPDSNDRVVYLDFDFERMLSDQRKDYLFVVSIPPSIAQLKKEYRHSIDAVTNLPGVTYMLQEGPKGMQVDSQTGLITWTPKKRQEAKVSVVLKAEGKTQRTVNFTIAAERVIGGLKSKEIAGGGQKATGFTRIEDSLLELPGKGTSHSFTQEGKVLLLEGSNLALLLNDGFTVEANWRLKRKFLRMFERDGYYIGLSNEPAGIYYLKKKTLEEFKSYPLTGRTVKDMVVHPTLPVCYVSAFVGGDLPQNRFIAFDERKMKGLENNDWFGNWLAISSDGKQMFTGYSDTYRSGSELLMNPTRWHIVPRYGSLNWLTRYSVDKSGRPKLLEIKPEVGRVGTGVVISGDDSSITYLSKLGFNRNLAGHDTSNFEVLPLVFPLEDKAITEKFAYHPVLKLAAALGKGANEPVLLFDTKTANQRSCLDKEDLGKLKGFQMSNLFFSPDGRHLIVEGRKRGVSYLHKLELNLEPEEIEQLEDAQMGKDEKRDGADIEI